MKLLTLLTVIQMTILSSFTSLANINIPKENISHSYAQKSDNATGINEQDFINTMFLKAEFFENWSDTNYFINPTLKTSQQLKYNEKWYLDYIADSYSTALAIEQTNTNFQNLYNNYQATINSYFQPVLSKLNSENKNWLQENLYSPLKQDKKFFLKNIMELMLHFAGSGMKYSKVRTPYGFYGYFGGSNNNTLKNKAISIDSKLKDFSYYTFYSITEALAYPYDDSTRGTYYDKKSSYDLFAKQLSSIDGVNDQKDYGRLLSVTSQFQSLALKFLNDYETIIIQELFRVQNGGSPNYNQIVPVEKSKKIIFYMEIIDELNKTERQYSFVLTMDNMNKIQAGNLKLHQLKNKTFQEKKLNFDFNFSFLKDNFYSLDTEIFSFNKETKIIHEKISGTIDLDEFLQVFFNSALIPVFQNRSSFIESSYLDNLYYDMILIDFFGLKDVDFRNVIQINKDTKNNSNWNSFIKNLIIISKEFYKDYLRALFDLNNNTYVQGQHAKHGLLANNGFKIYPRYFYFSDQYKNLDFSLYSAYQNRFYKTKYGKNFNFDFSVKKHFNIENDDGYIFGKKNSSENQKYKLKHLKFEERNLNYDKKIGFNIFEFQSAKIDKNYRYYDFNFGIYNWQEITKDGINPDKQWWEYKYESCNWWNIGCHIKNGTIWVINNLPGIKETNTFAKGMNGFF